MSTTIVFEAQEIDTLLNMFVEMIHGAPISADANVREVLSELLSQSNSDALRAELDEIPAEQQTLIEEAAGMTFEQMIEANAARHAVVSKIFNA